MSEQAAAGVRVNVYGSGEATVETGLPVLNLLLTRLAETARFDVVLDIEPGDTEAEVEAAAAALGHALAGPLRAEDARGYGAGALTSAEALAYVERAVTPVAAAQLAACTIPVFQPPSGVAVPPT